MKTITLELINNIFWASYPFGRGFKHTADNDAIVDALNAMNTTEDEIVEYTSTIEFREHAHGYHALRGLYKYVASKRGKDAPKKAPRRAPKAEGGKGGKGGGKDNEHAPKADVDADAEGEGAEGESEGAEGEDKKDAPKDGEGKDGGKDGGADGEGKDGGAEGEGEDKKDADKKDAPKDGESEDKKDADKKDADAEKAVHEKMRACLNVLTVAEMPLLMIGPAGSGKSFMAERLAEACGATKFFTQSKVSFDTDLKGYMDAYGNYVPTALYRALKRADVEGEKTAYFLDEIFAGDTSCLTVVNDLLSDGTMTFPNGETFSAKNLILMAADNTSGNGADNKYNTRNKADKSFLNRFGAVHVDYDKRVEKKLAGKTEGLLDFIYAVRAAAEHVDIDLVCSYRTIKGMAKYAKAGIDPKEAVDAFIYQDALTEDDKDTLRQDAKIERLIAKGNVYALAM